MLHIDQVSYPDQSLYLKGLRVWIVWFCFVFIGRAGKEGLLVTTRVLIKILV